MYQTFIKFEDIVAGTIFPNCTISFGRLYDFSRKFSGIYLKIVLPFIRTKEVLDYSNYNMKDALCKKHIMFRWFFEFKIKSKFETNKAWIEYEK